jgi:hypothetical protein
MGVGRDVDRRTCSGNGKLVRADAQLQIGGAIAESPSCFSDPNPPVRDTSQNREVCSVGMTRIALTLQGERLVAVHGSFTTYVLMAARASTHPVLTRFPELGISSVSARASCTVREGHTK